MPFAVVGSTDEIVVGGHKVRARQYPWGTVEGELLHTQTVSLTLPIDVMVCYFLFQLRTRLIVTLSNFVRCCYGELHTICIRSACNYVPNKYIFTYS